MAKDRKDSNGKRLHVGETQKQDGTYTFRIMKDGKRRQIYAQTLPELRRKEEALMCDIRDGINTTSMTLNQMADQYFSAKKNLRPSTLATYRILYDRHVRDTLGKRSLSKIRFSDILDVYTSLNRSYSTLSVLDACLRGIFDRAVRDCFIRIPPTVGALSEAKAYCTEGRDIYVPTRAEQESFLTFCRDTPEFSFWYPLFVVLQQTGLRASELCGLIWKDIDFEHNSISVNKILTYKNYGNGSKFHIGEPKTKAGCRVIPMLPQVRKALVKQKETNFAKGFQSVEVDGSELNLVFRTTDGKPTHDLLLNRIIDSIIKAHNDIEDMVAFRVDEYDPCIIPKFSCHAWRHAFATELCQSTSDLVTIKAIMGHTKVETTMNVYASSTAESTQNAFNALSERIS